jgi:hypothetical protein
MRYSSSPAEYIRLQWVDLINNVRCRVIPVSYFLKLLQSPRPGVGVAKAALGLVYLMTASGFSAVGEYLYVPDMASLKYCPYAPDEASVMGWFQEKSPVPGVDLRLSVEVNLCPRGILKSIVEYVVLQPCFLFELNVFPESQKEPMSTFWLASSLNSSCSSQPSQSRPVITTALVPQMGYFPGPLKP